MDLEHEIQRLTAALAGRHTVFADRTIERLVRRLFAQYTGATVRTYLPILVQREAHRQLADLDSDFTPSTLSPRRCRAVDLAVCGQVSTS